MFFLFYHFFEASATRISVYSLWMTVLYINLFKNSTLQQETAYIGMRREPQSTRHRCFCWSSQAHE